LAGGISKPRRAGGAVEMEGYVEGFLGHKLWRTSVSFFGPNLTLNVFCWGMTRYLKRTLIGRIWFKVMSALVGTPRDVYVAGHFRELLIHHYDRDMVPKKAQRLNPILVAVKCILLLLRVRFVWNVSPTTGHNTQELDYFFRLRLVGSADGRAVFLRRPSPIHNDSISLYGKRFWFASNNQVLCDLLFPIVVSTERLRIDCGLARGKRQLKADGTYHILSPDQTYLGEISKEENTVQRHRYYLLRNRTLDDAPLTDGVGCDAELARLLGNDGRKIALLHIKLDAINATAAASDPNAYLPAIRWLLENRYQVVFVGREAYPTQFKEFGVLNYSESTLASYRHDIQLFALAAVAITAGSGISYLADCMNKPYVYLDSWHLAMTNPSPRCVVVPCCVRERKRGRLLTFAEQNVLYFNLPDRGGERFPIDVYEGRNADAGEVLAALCEALSMNGTEPLSPEQSRYREILPKLMRETVRSRISQFFLDQHSELLADAPAG
jgi:putative glycosyltransferase (TIGR04372 family)